jgi:hypothetical protein
MSDRNVIGLFARADHPKGWGYQCDAQGYGKAHGYVVLLVACRDDDELALVEERLRDFRSPFHGRFESGPYSEGYLGEWFGGCFDLVAKLNAGEHSIVVGPWQPEPRLIICKGDNRLIAQFTAEEVLRSPVTELREVKSA